MGITQYLKFQFTMPKLLRHYDVIFEESLQKLINCFIYDLIQMSD